MIDIHCHILPGLDDGAQSMEESLAMARTAVDQGIHTLIATPHHGNGTYLNEAEVVFDAVERLNSEIDTAEIPLKVLPGQEIRVRRQLLNELVENKLLSLHGTRYILLEFPFIGIPDYADEIIHELRVMNLIPVIAHPERYADIVYRPERLYEFVQQGALSQLTAQSVTGSFGKKLQTVSLDLCRRNLVHFIASDAHDLKVRPFELTSAYDWINKKLGMEYVRFFQQNAVKLSENQEIEEWEPLIQPKRRFRIW